MTEKKKHDPRRDWVTKHSYFGTGKKREHQEPREISVRPAYAHEWAIAQRLVGAAVELAVVFVWSDGKMRVRDAEGNEYVYEASQWQE